jgi:CheY-like chemotaxis protein
MQRILVCDDDAPTVRALRVILRDAGFRVDATASAHEALDAAALRPPAAAIVDLALPDADGVDLCRQLREWSAIALIVPFRIFEPRKAGVDRDRPPRLVVRARQTWTPTGSRRLDEPETATPSGTSIAPAVPGDLEHARVRAPPVRSTLRHSLVGVSTAPMAPLPEKRQREQPLHRSLHHVTSALD